MVSCRLTGTCTIALRSLVKRGNGGRFEVARFSAGGSPIDSEIARHI